MKKLFNLSNFIIILNINAMIYKYSNITINDLTMVIIII